MKIAVVGGIGCGKSEVLSVARSLGLTCVSADEINAELLRDGAYIKKISAKFPNVVKDGKIDKAALSAEVFSDKKKRALLNSVAHPEIMKRMAEYAGDIIVAEIPLFLESGSGDIFDEVIFVCAPVCKRIKRLKSRGVAPARALKIMFAQAAPRKIKSVSTRFINNCGGLVELREKAEKIFGDIVKK